MIQTKTFEGYNKQVWNHHSDNYFDVWQFVDKQVNEFLKREDIEYVDIKPNGNKSTLVYRVK